MACESFSKAWNISRTAISAEQHRQVGDGSATSSRPTIQQTHQPCCRASSSGWQRQLQHPDVPNAQTSEPPTAATTAVEPPQQQPPQQQAAAAAAAAAAARPHPAGTPPGFLRLSDELRVCLRQPISSAARDSTATREGEIRALNLNGPSLPKSMVDQPDQKLYRWRFRSLMYLTSYSLGDLLQVW